MNLNRQQRRKMEREKSVAAKTISNFTPKQMEVIDNITKARAREICETEFLEINHIMDRCLSAFLIEKFPEKSWNDISNFEDELSELILEDTTKWKKLFEGKDNEMGAKLLKDIEEKIEIKVKELIEKNVKQKEAIEVLVSAFPTLSRSMLINAYKKIKDEVPRSAIDDEVKKATDYIFGEDDPQEPKEELKENKNNLVCGEVEGVKVSNLKVVKKVLEVEGQFGTYTVNENGVTTGEENFKNVDDFKKYKEREMKLFEMRCNEIEEVFGLA